MTKENKEEVVVEENVLTAENFAKEYDELCAKYSMNIRPTLNIHKIEAKKEVKVEDKKEEK